MLKLNTQKASMAMTPSARIITGETDFSSALKCREPVQEMVVKDSCSNKSEQSGSSNDEEAQGMQEKKASKQFYPMRMSTFGRAK